VLQTPAWFGSALADAPEHASVEVLGAQVHVRLWGDPESPGLVLVHGGSAHSGWWDHVAPLLADTHRVVAIDLTGHGDSDWRTSYDMPTWVTEVLSVAEAFTVGRPVVLGHSRGGWVALNVAAAMPDALAGVVVVDSPLFADQPDGPPRPEQRPTRVYADREEALSRFKTTPDQDVLLPYVGRHVAEQSLRAVPGGWTWKFDPALNGPGRVPMQLPPGHGLRRGVFLRSEFGLVNEEMIERLGARFGAAMPVVDLPGAGHHPMLDRPLSLVAALRPLLGALS
jgi:pimeloyl-ACP methyl ester carboxylesterase